jgi:2-hydroxychromene-2-carboxylate isomerase
MADSDSDSVADVEFFFDPVCPWAWITSRWVEEVARQRDLQVMWRFIALRIVNEAKDYERDFPKGYPEVHGTGLKMLRVCAAAREASGNDAVARLYTRFGTDLHVERKRPEIVSAFEAGFPDYLRSVGLDEALVAAANDPAWDGIIREETEEALTRTGRDVGTPIITFGAQSFFGPVMSRVPRGEDAVRLWDAVWTVATFPGMAELKRSLREPPQPAT